MYFVLALLLAAEVGAQTTLSWQHPVPQGNMLMSVHAISDGSLIATGQYGTVLRSTDGGAHWNNTMFGLTDNVINAAEAGAGMLWAVADNGILLRSSDGGGDWLDFQSITSQGLNAVGFSTADIGIACGDAGTIIRTTDAGGSWVTVFSGVNF